MNPQTQTEANNNVREYEYGAMSSKYKLKAKNKLTAYIAMVMHYDRSAHLLIIYSPEECKKDNWLNPAGQISARLDEIFGGEGSFDKYVRDNVNEIMECYRTIEQIC